MSDCFREELAFEYTLKVLEKIADLTQIIAKLKFEKKQLEYNVEKLQEEVRQLKTHSSSSKSDSLKA
jgi:phage shock protein A